ncbi:MAG: B12-binding domain-containing radical SAM protein [Candidatus Omnitrophica bacterium]|nr:B12-binding domain-containing radical SAM protein [Candidatus Omnitrophota bacterium]
MKITFIDPPNFLNKRNVERVFGCTYSLYPIPNIWALYNASVLKRKGFEVNYIDMANEGWSKNDFFRFIRIDDSDIYCIYSVNLSMESDLFVSRKIREIKDNVYIFFCGPAPTYFRQSFLKDEKTFVIRGETEDTIEELLDSLDKKKEPVSVKGISFIKRNRMLDTPARPLIENLDMLPHPARYLLKRDLYYNPKLPKKPFTVMQTSRNCPYRCIFCVPNSSSFAIELEYRRHNQNRKPPIRLRSAESVILEFKKLKEEGYKSVSIIDDQFFWDKERTLKICEGIKNFGLEWGCLARADHLDEGTVKALSYAGCRYVDIGIESFKQEILDDIKKDLKVENIYRAIELLKKYNILVKINIILGASVLQSKEDIKDDIRTAKTLEVDAVMFSIATPFPGTEFYSLAKKNLWFIKGDYYPESVQTRSIISYPGLNFRELNYLVKFANLSFYLDLRFLKKNIRYILNPRYFLNVLKAFKRKFF